MYSVGALLDRRPGMAASGLGVARSGKRGRLGSFPFTGRYATGKHPHTSRVASLFPAFASPHLGVNVSGRGHHRTIWGHARIRYVTAWQSAWAACQMP